MLLHGWQTLPERGVVRSHKPFRFVGTNHISRTADHDHLMNSGGWSDGQCHKGKEKERKRIYIAPFIYYVYLKALRHGSQFYLQIHHASLSFVCVHQMAPPLTEVRDI